MADPSNEETNAGESKGSSMLVKILKGVGVVFAGIIAIIVKIAFSGGDGDGGSGGGTKVGGKNGSAMRF